MRYEPRATLTRNSLKYAGVAVTFAAVAGGAYIRSIAQVLPLPLPLPVPKSRSESKGWPSTGSPEWMVIGRVYDYSVLLCQVVSIQAANMPPALAGGSFPEVITGRFHVVETLSGPPENGELTVVNPVPNHSLAVSSGEGPAATRIMRRGELWIVFFNNRTKEIDKWASFWLTGPTDPMLAAYRLHLAWMNRRDSLQAMSEMKTTVQEQHRSFVQRYTALVTLDAYDGSPAQSGPDASARHTQCKKIVTELLADSNLPAPMKSRLIRMTSIDLTHDLAAGSNDSIQLHFLLDLVANSQDDQTVDEAANRLYFVMVQQPSPPNKPTTTYFCPEIVQALEERLAADKADGKVSFVSRTLSNLDLIQRRRLSDIQKYNLTNLVVRHVPPR